MPEAVRPLEQRAWARVGTSIRGKYRIVRVLGIGGMATVYAAEHRNGHRVAIKMLHPELSLRSDISARFVREGYVSNRVRHAGAVRVLDDDTAEDGAAFLVMELLIGHGSRARPPSDRRPRDAPGGPCSPEARRAATHGPPARRGRARSSRRRRSARRAPRRGCPLPCPGASRRRLRLSLPATDGADPRRRIRHGHDARPA